MTQKYTTIQVTQEIWAELNRRKKDSSETFIDVLIKVLGLKTNRIDDQDTMPGTSSIDTNTKEVKS